MGSVGLVDTGRYPSAFAFSLLLLAPLFLVAPTTGLLERPSILGVLGIVAVLLGLLLGWRLPGFLGVLRENHSAAKRVAAAIAVLAWGPLMVTQFRNIPLLSDLRIRSTSSAAWLGSFDQGVSVLTLASISVVLLAAAISAAILSAVRKASREELQPIARPAWRGITLVWTTSVLVFVALAA